MPDPITGSIVAGGAGLSAVLGSSAARRAAKTQEKAATTAAEAQVRSAEIAAETTKEMYETARGDIAPWRAAGMYGLEKLIGARVPSDLEAPVREDYYKTEITPEPLSYNYLRGLDFESLRNMVRSGEISEQVYDNLVKNRLPSVPNKWLKLAARAPVTKKVRVFDEKAYGEAEADYNRQLAEREEARPPGLLELGPGAFEESPGYQFRQSEGLKALEHAAVGKKLSPSTAKAISRYGQDYASTEYDKFLNRYYKRLDPYFNLAGLGQTAAGQMATGATTTGTNLANIEIGSGQAQALAALQAGQARASGYINQANAITEAIGSGVDLFTLYNMGAFK